MKVAGEERQTGGMTARSLQRIFRVVHTDHVAVARFAQRNDGAAEAAARLEDEALARQPGHVGTHDGLGARIVHAGKFVLDRGAVPHVDPALARAFITIFHGASSLSVGLRPDS